VDGGQAGHVDDHPGRHLRLPQRAVPLAAGRHLDVVLAGEVDEAGDVRDRARPQHGPGPAVDGVAVVVGGGGQRRVVGEELAVEVREPLCQIRTAARQLGRRGPAPQLRVEAEDGHRRQSP
jgi:hypothetical protein